MVTRKDICAALGRLDIRQGDTVLVHSSFKSLGPVDGGAETVVTGLLDALGETGTLVMPAFTQKDFYDAYDTWYLDKPSDTGWLTEYFRKRPGTLRSDQATHSVVAVGPKAKELTATHGHTHKRFGSMGDTPFSADSPWEKMYRDNVWILMLGVDVMKITFRHYTEYVYMERLLEKLSQFPEYDAMKGRLYRFGVPGVWPHIFNLTVADRLEAEGKMLHTQCGNAELIAVRAKTFVDRAMRMLVEKEDSVLRPGKGDLGPEGWKKWRSEYEEIVG